MSKPEFYKYMYVHTYTVTTVLLNQHNTTKEKHI